MTSSVTGSKIRSYKKPIRIGMMSLGCPKTLVDSEFILGMLQGRKYKMARSVTDCDVAIINTCAFIQEAQQESVDRILELIELKKQNSIGALVVLGCLVQRFPRELQDELGEVDAFLGSGEYDKIASVIDRVVAGERVVAIGGPGHLDHAGIRRLALTPPHYRYIKISEGCDHACSFCTIPLFRGKHRSRALEDIEREVRGLVGEGAKEIILTGQDTSYYGRDRGGRYLLPELIRRLDRITGMKWLRILYAYPSCVNEELIEAMRNASRVCRYLDLPLQHVSDRILTAMKRGITKKATLGLVRKLREAMPDLAIRTTFIVGFPGETEEDFEEILECMEQVRFERLGIFAYSREAGSSAADMPGQVPEEIKEQRLRRAMLLQQKISREFNEKMIGKTLEIVVEERAAKKKNIWVGRSEMDAPEVDGNVWVRSAVPLKIGAFYPVKINAVHDYDLAGEYDKVSVAIRS